MTRYPIVAIEWVDAHTCGGWRPDSAIEGFSKKGWYCTDIGILLRETKRVIVFAHTLAPPFEEEEGIQWAALHRIPTTWVRRRIVLGYINANGRVTRREKR